MLFRLVSLASVVVVFYASNVLAQCPEVPLDSGCAAAAPLPAGVTRTDLIQNGVDFLIDSIQCVGTGEPKWMYDGADPGNCDEGGIRRQQSAAATALCGEAIARGGDPGDATVQQRIREAANFLIAQAQPTCAESEWAFYSLRFFLTIEELAIVPEGLGGQVCKTIDKLIRSLEDCFLSSAPDYKGGIPAYGSGYNATFKTAPALIVLYEASIAGYDVNTAAWNRGIDSLVRSWLPKATPLDSSTMYFAGNTLDPGAYHYQECRPGEAQCVVGTSSWGVRATVPGSIGRIPLCETALYLWGQGSQDRVEGALDVFFNGQYEDANQVVRCIYEHMADIAETGGNHTGPFEVAPYYLYSAHRGVARAIHHVACQADRDAMRQRQLELLYWSQQFDAPGGNPLWYWDQNAPEAPNPTTAMVVLALLEHTITFPPPPPPTDVPFIRGDSNGNGGVDISDAINTLDFLFLGEGAICCMDAADANDDGKSNITDSIFTLGFLFLGEDPIPAPYPDAGPDPTPDEKSCCKYWEG